MGDNKKFWRSKTFFAGAAMILLSVSEAIVSGLSWRECVGAALGTAVIVFRTVATKRIMK